MDINKTALNLKHVRYSRKSDEAKERQEYSISEQNLECDKYTLREKLNIVSKLEEEKSAFKPNKRPVFDEMLELIKTGQADAILTWKENRLCRNPREGGEILQLLQDGVIKEIRCVSTNAVYTQDSDHLVLQIHFGMANQFSRNLSKDVRRGLEHKAARGEYPRPAPIGFESYGEVRKRQIREHPFEGPIIRELYEMAATGKYSIPYLVEHSYKKGLRTQKGGKISKSHLHHILTCTTYHGYFYHKGELYKGNYEPIVSKPLWDAVQKALHDKSKPRIHSWDNPYNGLAKCKNCGCAITTSVKVKFYKRTNRRQTYIYLHCTKRRGKCKQAPISVAEFEKQLLENMSQITIDEQVWALGIKLLKEKHKDEVTKNMGQLNHLQLKYKSLQDKLNRLIDMRANEELTKEEFLIQKETHLQEQARIENLLKDNKETSRNWLELAENFLNIAFYAREVMLSDKQLEKKNVILDVGENLFLNNKRLEFSFKKPFDILLQPQYRTNVLPG